MGDAAFQPHPFSLSPILPLGLKEHYGIEGSDRRGSDKSSRYITWL
jgi:hypothetical protein